MIAMDVSRKVLVNIDGDVVHDFMCVELKAYLPR
jgi:hypothetical protein